MLEAVRHANAVYVGKGRFDRQKMVDEAVALGEWGTFSNRQIAHLTGLRPAFVNELTGKTDRTGGTMNADRLGDVALVIISKANGEDVKARLVELLGDGFSTTMLSRMTGVSANTLSRWARK